MLLDPVGDHSAHAAPRDSGIVGWGDPPTRVFQTAVPTLGIAIFPIANGHVDSIRLESSANR